MVLKNRGIVGIKQKQIPSLAGEFQKDIYAQRKVSDSPWSRQAAEVESIRKL